MSIESILVILIRMVFGKINMNNLNIVYFIPSLTNAGGMERVLTQKVNYLAKSGKYNISVITTDMPDGEEPFFQLDKEVKVYRFKLFFNDIYNDNFISKIINTYKKLTEYRKLLELFLSKNKVDVLISMGGKELEFLYKVQHPAKKIYEAHFSNGIRTRNLLANKGNSFFWKYIAKLRELQIIKQTKKLDALVVLTEKSKDEWLKTNENVLVIPNPSSIKTFPNQYDVDSRRVISLGRLEYEKGFDLLIKAWSRVITLYPMWKLDIYGSGSLVNSLKDLIQELNLTSSVQLCGVTQQVSSELLKSSFYVLPSRYEGLPLVMLECLACGLPMVAFDCETGPSDIIENNDCGLLVSNGDIEELSLKIIDMIKMAEKRLVLSKACTLKSEKYAVDNIMSRWKDLFESMV